MMLIIHAFHRVSCRIYGLDINVYSALAAVVASWEELLFESVLC